MFNKFAKKKKKQQNNKQHVYNDTLSLGFIERCANVLLI